ncbi:MAG: type III secretion system effector protein [Deltaproteobacteria bacterium]|nr:type III secretion system effector protein [Deltaproteobacteria bacterium]
MFESLTSSLASLNPFASDAATAAPAAAPAFDAAAAAPAASGAGGGAIDWFKGLFDHGEPGLGDVVKQNRKDLQEHFALESAKEQLKGKFQVGEGTGPNAVSPEEFEKIAKLYGSIRDGKSDIKLDASGVDKDNRGDVRQKALDDMSTMLTTPAGRKLLGDLANNEAVDPNDPTKTIHRTTTLKLSDNKFDENDADAAGMAAARASGDNDAAKAIEQKATTKGQGVNAVVNFLPGVSKMLDGPNVMSTGDTALFHELTHAYHITHGTKIDSGQTYGGEGRDAGQRLEELATVGLNGHQGELLTENEYRRERAQLDPSVQQRPTYH